MASLRGSESDLGGLADVWLSAGVLFGPPMAAGVGRWAPGLWGQVEGWRQVDRKELGVHSVIQKDTGGNE